MEGKGRLREGALRPGEGARPLAWSGRGAKWPRMLPQTVLAQRHHRSTRGPGPLVTHQAAWTGKQAAPGVPGRASSALQVPTSCVRQPRRVRPAPALRPRALCLRRWPDPRPSGGRLASGGTSESSRPPPTARGGDRGRGRLPSKAQERRPWGNPCRDTCPQHRPRRLLFEGRRHEHGSWVHRTGMKCRPRSALGALRRLTSDERPRGGAHGLLGEPVSTLAGGNRPRAGVFASLCCSAVRALEPPTPARDSCGTHPALSGLTREPSPRIARLSHKGERSRPPSAPVPRARNQLDTLVRKGTDWKLNLQNWAVDISRRFRGRLSLDRQLSCRPTAVNL